MVGAGVPPLNYLEISIFGYPTEPKNFLKAPLAPINSKFEGGERAKKTRFLDQNFPLFSCRIAKL